MHLQACPTKKFNLMPAFLTHAEYWLAALLFLWGVYGVLASNHLLRKLMAMNIMQVGVIVFFIALAAKSGATAPVVVDVNQSIQASGYVNPLPHALMLTAIVVSVSTTGVALALLIRIQRRYGTLQETTLLERLKQ
jgi:multicomponent Na+:H+ antiporter subunit C